MRYLVSTCPKILSTVLLCFLVVFPATAQDKIHKVYLPMIIAADTDNNFRYIKPQASTNYVLNPSAEIAGNFAAVATGTATRVTTYQKYGLYSYEVASLAIGDGIQLTTGTLTNVQHYVTFRARIAAGQVVDIPQVVINSVTHTPRLIETIDGDWALYGVGFNAATVNGQTALQIISTSTTTFYVDGVQIEPLGFWTTYIDGTQDGCEWLGVAHAAISQRSGESRAGGISQDFYAEYGLQIRRIVSAGAAPRSLSTSEYAILPGGELNSVKVQSREFTIIGKFIGTSEEDLHAKEQALLAELSDTSYVNSQPFRIRFNGAEVQKEIKAHYNSGLEGDLAAFYGCIEIVEDELFMDRHLFTEDVAIQFTAPDPFWEEVGESAILLDTNDSATLKIIAARLRDTGQWDELGPPNVGGVYTATQALEEDEAYIYFGGDFTDFDNIPNADYIAQYRKQDGAFSALDTGTDDAVLAIAKAPDGSIYVGGSFALAGGVANTSRIARWDGSSWTALGTGCNGTVNAITIGLDGKVYVGGSFTLAGGIANTDGIAVWDGSSWAALDTGIDGATGVAALAIGIDGSIYAGGSFATMSGVANTSRIAKWDGSSWSALSTGMDSTVTALAVGINGILYAGGSFTTAGGNSASRVASWNGATWSSLSEGVNNLVSALSISQDGILWAGGSFTEAGGITLADRIARWNGYVWGHPDINLPGSPTTFAILASQYTDPTVEQNYDLWTGFNTSGTGNFAGLVTTPNDGTAPIFPKIVYTRSGGTTATIETLRNERTGLEILFDYDLLDGETLTIDLNPTNRTIISSMFGSRLDAKLPGSDFGTWALLPGDNDVTSFVNVAGAPTIVAYMLWRTPFDGYN